MLGLVLTSLGFLVPTVLAFRNHRKRMGVACSILTITSTLFHSTYHPVAKAIDVSYVYCIATYYIHKSIWNLIQRKRWRDLYVHVGSLGCVALYFQRCNHPDVPQYLQKRFHMLFHIAAQTLFSMHALDKK